MAYPVAEAASLMAIDLDDLEPPHVNQVEKSSEYF